MYAKASFSTEEFEACDSAMAVCALLTSMPRVRTCSPLGLLYQSEYGYARTLLLLSVRLVGADYRLLLLSLIWCSAWTHHIFSDFRVFRIREGSLRAE